MNIDYVIYSLYISESTYSHRFPDFLTFHQVEVETNSGALLADSDSGFPWLTLQGIHPRFLVAL